MLISSIDAVLPNEIPSDDLIAEWLLCTPLSQAISELGKNSGDSITNSVLLDELQKLLSVFPLSGNSIVDAQGQPDDLAHDAFFHVRRLRNDEPAVFVRSILSARLIFLRECTDQSVNISRDELQVIDQGFADLLSCLLGARVDEARRVEKWHLLGETCHAMQRWVHGHLIFAILSQGLILSFRSLGQALQLGKTKDVQKWADLSISLMNASGAAFVFTGDFAPEEYQDTIRPSMTPPQTPICLSGLMSADHTHMAQTIRDMRPALQALAELEPDRHNRIAEAVGNVYDRHIFVCERFVGAEPSILTAGRTQRTGPSLVEQFKTLRLKPFEHSQHAQGMAAPHSAVTLGTCPFKH